MVLSVVAYDRQRRHSPACGKIRRRASGGIRKSDLDLANTRGKAGATTHTPLREVDLKVGIGSMN
jgi:hypothetical protein